MNEILSPFMVKTGGVNYFSFGRSGHRYEGFIEEDYSQENNVASLGEEERQYASKINIKALAYVFGADKNEEQPFFVRRQNAVEVRIGREKLILGQITDEDTTPDMELIFPKPISAQSSRGSAAVFDSVRQTSAQTEAHPLHRLAQDGVINSLEYTDGVLTAKRTKSLPDLTVSINAGADGVVSSLDFSGSTLTAERTESLADLTATLNVAAQIAENTVYREEATGTQNGVNRVFTTSTDFVSGSELVFHNGLLQRDGGDQDYEVSGDNEITFTSSKFALTAINSHDHLLISFVKT